MGSVNPASRDGHSRVRGGIETLKMAQVLALAGFATLAAASTCACASTVVGPPPARSDVPEGSEVRDLLLGEGDVVEIRVFREPDLAGIYRVNPNGEIDFPFIGKVPLLGKNADVVAEEIRARLSAGYLQNPQVTVFIREHNSQKIHVLGQVNQAGSFAYQPGMTVIQAITLAGGFTKLAATNRVRVTRVSDGPEKIFDVPVGDIGSGRAPNFELLPGDIVFAPESIF